MNKFSVPTSILILYRPTEAVERIKQNQNYLRPLLVLSVFAAIYFYFFDPAGTLLTSAYVFTSKLFNLFTVAIVESFIIFYLLKLFKKNVSFFVLLTLTSYILLIPNCFYLLLNYNLPPDGPQITDLSYWIPSSGIVTTILNNIDITIIWQFIMVFFTLRKLAHLTTIQTSILIGIIILLGFLILLIH